MSQATRSWCPQSAETSCRALIEEDLSKSNPLALTWFAGVKLAQSPLTNYSSSAVVQVKVSPKIDVTPLVTSPLGNRGSRRSRKEAGGPGGEVGCQPRELADG